MYSKLEWTEKHNYGEPVISKKLEWVSFFFFSHNDCVEFGLREWIEKDAFDR